MSNQNGPQSSGANMNEQPTQAVNLDQVNPQGFSAPPPYGQQPQAYGQAPQPQAYGPAPVQSNSYASPYAVPGTVQSSESGVGSLLRFAPIGSIVIAVLMIVSTWLSWVKISNRSR
jgi:hypothetical protein